MQDASKKILVVFGGRNYHNQQRVDREIAAEAPDKVVHGDAPGADTCARRWCEKTGTPQRSLPADWDDITVPGAVVRQHPDGRKYNLVAGFMRNQRLLDEERPTHGLQFPGHTGTADMAKRCKAAGIPVRVIIDDGAA
jgi:hypothetical protein